VYVLFGDPRRCHFIIELRVIRLCQHSSSRTSYDNIMEVNKEEEDVCPICLDVMEPYTMIKTICGHRYHGGCLLPIFQLDPENSKCPMCRRDFNDEVVDLGCFFESPGIRRWSLCHYSYTFFTQEERDIMSDLGFFNPRLINRWIFRHKDGERYPFNRINTQCMKCRRNIEGDIPNNIDEKNVYLRELRTHWLFQCREQRQPE
jgi:hypothetical protein